MLFSNLNFVFLFTLSHRFQLPLLLLLLLTLGINSLLFLASIAIYPGDIVLMATDGLFDNLDLDEIMDEISVWEKKWFSSCTAEELQQPSAQGPDAMFALARALVTKARELSLDKGRDSPFAVLAKENDILWSGGMPDDTTVVVARVLASPQLR